MSTHDSGRRFALSLAAGLLLIPLSATAGFAVINGIATAPEETATTLAIEPEEATTTTPAAQIVVEPVAATPDDLARACGPDGERLITAEIDGTISDVQQAALDALRQICADAGLALPDPAAPPPVVRTVVAGEASPTTTVEQRAEIGEDHGRNDDHGDEDEEDHEDEDEHEHEHEHEDDD